MKSKEKKKKKQNQTILIFRWEIHEIQRDKTFTGLHGEAEKSNLSDMGLKCRPETFHTCFDPL